MMTPWHRRSLFLPLLLLAGSLFTTTVSAHGDDEEFPFVDDLAEWMGVGGPVDDLNGKIGESKKRIEDIGDEQKRLDREIAAAREQGATLSSQITVLDDQIRKAELSIEKTGAEIDETKLEIDKTQIELDIQTEKITKQKRVLSEFLRELYRQDRVSTLEILLSHASLSDFLDEQQRTETLQRETQGALDRIQVLRDELDWKARVLIAKKETLEDLKKRLNEEKALFDSQRQGKVSLLNETQSQEEKYAALLEQAKKEQRDVEQEIKNAQAEIQRLLEQEQRKNNLPFVPGDGTLSWPVQPIHGISAYFRDASYLRFFGVPHNAIDVPTPQGTALHAPANGYVVKYRNAGMGYSYILLAHGNGLSTLYGHVTASYVNAGDTVNKGDVIGLSGATPGTPGAGFMTTGPHLHFEVHKNGVPVDPLGFLPKP